jgi:hypothetical protein
MPMRSQNSPDAARASRKADARVVFPELDAPLRMISRPRADIETTVAALPSGSSAARPSCVVAQIDDAEAIAFGVGEDDEVGIVGVEVPLDSLGTERYEALGLARLFR